MIYPPFCDVCVVSTQSFSREKAEKTIKDIFGCIKELIDNEYKTVKVIILGPSVAAIAKVNNKYRFRMIIKCKNNAEFRKMLRTALDGKSGDQTTVSVDMNPETVI
jgi:primosomal protein N' (replication factor Y)